MSDKIDKGQPIYLQNNYILALFLFQFGILQPICGMINSQAPVALFSLCLIGYALAKNNLRISKNVLYIFGVVTVVFMLSIFFHSSIVDSTFYVYVQFVIKCVPGIYAASLKFEQHTLWEAFEKMALLNYICLFWFPVFSLADKIGYMRYGYAMLPSVLIFMSNVFRYGKRKRILYGFLFLISAAEMVIYGSRGTIICVAIFVSIQLLFGRLHVVKKICLVSAIALGSILTIQYDLLLRVLIYLSDTMHLETYTLIKFRMMLETGLSSSSSGRDIIYAMAFKTYEQKPILGNGIGYSLAATEQTTHNFILQILVESGMIGCAAVVMVLMVLMFLYFKVRKNKNYEVFLIATMLISVSAGRLLVSSDFWQRPELWMFAAFVMGQSASYFRRDAKTYLFPGASEQIFVKDMMKEEIES